MIEIVREKSGGGWVEAGGVAAVEFGADGVEIDEPALEQRPRHRLQRRVHPPVQLDLVVQRPEHRRDGFLLGDVVESERQVKLCYVARMNVLLNADVRRANREAVALQNASDRAQYAE